MGKKVGAALKLEKMVWALKEHCRFNHIRNDLDAYLWEVAKYALGETAERPDPKDYGLPSHEISG